MTDEDIRLRRTVAVCRDCSPPLPVPFDDLPDALAWRLAHRDGTDHEVRIVAGWPPPEEAVAVAFPEGVR